MEEVTILVLINDPYYGDNLLFMETKDLIFITTRQFSLKIRGKDIRIRKEDFGKIIISRDFSMAVYCESSRKLNHGFYPETMSHAMKGELSIKIEEHARKIANKNIEKMEEY